MNKILISIIIGITTIFGIAIFLYIEIKYPDYFNILNGLFTLVASLATIFAACFAVITMQDFKKQKRAELLSQLSKEKLETIDFIGGELLMIFIIIKDRNLNKDNIAEHNFEYLSTCLRDIKDNDKLSTLCINFDKEVANIYMLVNQEGKELITDTASLLPQYIGLLWSLNENIKEQSLIPQGQEKILNLIDKNKIIYKKIDGNITKLKALLNNSFLYL